MPQQDLDRPQVLARLNPPLQPDGGLGRPSGSLVRPPLNGSIVGRLVGESEALAKVSRGTTRPLP
jgi:hypothetical protein